MQVLVPASQGHYGAGQTWRTGPNARNGSDGSEAKFDLPKDTYWMSGHDGQTVAIIPSRQLVVVRLGLTPSRLGYQPQALLAFRIARLFDCHIEAVFDDGFRASEP